MTLLRYIGLLKKKNKKKECQMAIFNFVRHAHKLRYHGNVIHSFDWKSTVQHDGGVKMHDSVLSARYSPICNVLRLWRIWLIPTYRVYRLYDKIMVVSCNRWCIVHPAIFTTGHGSFVQVLGVRH